MVQFHSVRRSRKTIMNTQAQINKANQKRWQAYANDKTTI